MYLCRLLQKFQCKSEDKRDRVGDIGDGIGQEKEFDPKQDHCAAEQQPFSRQIGKDRAHQAGILQTPEVVTQVLAALKREQGATSETDAIVALHEFDALWGQFFPAEQARIIHLLIRRVTVTAAGLEVDIRREGIAGVIREMVAPRRMQAAE